jgi:hypothetical protein
MGSLLHELIYYRVYKRFSQRKIYTKLTEVEKKLLDQIRKPQRIKWKKNQTIPIKVLEVFWLWKIHFQKVPPYGGINLHVFTDKLDDFINFSNSDLIVIDQAEYLFNNIVKYEYQGNYRKMIRRK